MQEPRIQQATRKEPGWQPRATSVSLEVDHPAPVELSDGGSFSHHPDSNLKPEPPTKLLQDS